MHARSRNCLGTVIYFETVNYCVQNGAGAVLLIYANGHHRSQSQGAKCSGVASGSVADLPTATSLSGEFKAQVHLWLLFALQAGVGMSNTGAPGAKRNAPGARSDRDILEVFGHPRLTALITSRNLGALETTVGATSLTAHLKDHEQLRCRGFAGEEQVFASKRCRVACRSTNASGG